MNHHQPAVPRRILALDPGEARIGVAISDDLGMLAHPRAAILARDRRRALEAIADLVEREQVAEIIVGLPLSLSGAHGPQARAAEAFAADLRRAVAVPVRTADERLTSAQAARQAPAAARRRDGTLDSLAAALLLQAELDARGRRP
jgi:putative Holliday junction resolvase